MKNKAIISILICALVLSALCSCAGKNKNIEKTDSGSQTEEQDIEQPEKHEMVLTERQKKILREKGLPEEYDQLNDIQKNAIEKIEMALSYLEETYDDEFEYEGYVSGGLDGQYVTAKIKDTYPAKYVNVYITYKKDHYEYSDNYKEMMAVTEYEEQVKEFLSSYFDPSDFQVYVEISRLKEEGDSVVERAVGIPDIMINGVYSEEEMEEAAQAYAEWIAGMEHKNGGGIDFRIYNPEDYAKINKFNYKKYYGEHILRLCVTVHSDKSIEIKRY